MDRILKELMKFEVAEEDGPIDASAPEKSLMAAVLITALEDLKTKGYEQGSAKRYLLSDDKEDVFSFLSVCEHLEMDPNLILNLAKLGKVARVQSKSK